MLNRKKRKTIDDYSVSQLLDDFLSPDAHDITSSTKDIDDEEYVRMMLKKDVQRELERLRRHGKTTSKTPTTTKESILDEAIKERFFPNVRDVPIEEEVQVEESIVTDILDSLVANDMPSLTAKMREAVNFLQDEMGVSESEQRLVESLDRYRKLVESGRVLPQISNDNVLVLKRCQNCYYCTGEQTRRGVVWCLCTNLERSTDVEIDDSWVKSEINLACWKARRD